MHFLDVPFSLIKIKPEVECNLYYFDPRANQRLVAHYAYEDLLEEQYMAMDHMISKGAILQILFEDLDLFCTQMDCHKELIEQANQFLFSMITKQQNRFNKYIINVSEPFLIKNLIKTEKSLKFLIERVKAEVLLFPLSISPEVSFTTEIVEKLYLSDTAIVQESALAYYLAKVSKIHDPEILSSIILASLFKDVGLNQLPRNKLQDQNIIDDPWYLKHPMLSIYLLTKTNFDFSKLTKRLILEHHEVADGSGFPKQKTHNQLDVLSGFIKAAYEFCHAKSKKPELTHQQILKQLSLDKTIQGEQLHLPKLALDSLVFLET